ncbi:cysteinyl-tRNA synthetase [Nadsonia fulvescens var. elongata DSM 6958]|uniref:cysteine--tRNA ligase n=1 Tax=Nadsonia fulvescens var. elongata DSM 6958 TaxID=857566 RepID=A0A1E3PRL7_9ASCO|nr:cysteinyl-tRNA synthetase [Nadsonia fulvescens var. elongata DSM 6958]
MASVTSTEKVQQPEWLDPKQDVTESRKTPTLKLYNTLTRSKNDFVPISGKKVTWYSCGPTVYDSSHMGHARNYVSIDINRRILEDYFGYDVYFVQNVTDIDDKIIIRARQNFLFEQYKSQQTQITDALIEKISNAWSVYTKSNLPVPEDITLETFNKWSESVDIAEEAVKNPKFPMHLTASKSAFKAIQSKAELSSADILNQAKDILVPILDAESGSSIKDPSIFRDLPAFWENKFDEDMRSLNVLPATVTTRVSEYVPEIITFVQGIIENKYAYQTEDGSVYFDTGNFDGHNCHSYAKLQPWNKGKKDLIDEGEGSLSKPASGKKSNNDFALWKGSKPGEPAWASPWGEGRPGWHIECSVMASEVLGSHIDIHSGGIDLAFPHHDNELAQSEAYHNCPQWVNYFLHTGHLHIEGQKMSKSLKNFITIGEALEKYSARQLRLAFAFQQWNNSLDFKEALIKEVKAFEGSLNKFFAVVRALVAEDNHATVSGKIISKKVTPLEKKLYQQLDDAKVAVHAALCDNLAVPIALQTISELVQKSNIYLTTAGIDSRVTPVSEVAKWISKFFSILGFEVRPDNLGWSEASTDASGSTEEIIMPYLNVLSTFRDSVRFNAIEKVDHSEFLKTCDQIRNIDLLNLGISLDDRANGQPALVKILNESEKNELIQQQKEKEQREQEKTAKKALAAQKEEEERLKKLEKAKIPPSEMFQSSTEYSQWDKDGMPTHDAEGEPISKSMKKKLTKLYDQQKKLHDQYLESPK